MGDKRYRVGGTRGGQDQFKWDDVKSDVHRENYLGHSLLAPVGRWQRGKDLKWWNKREGRGGADAARAQADMEKARLKQLDEDLLNEALGLGPRVVRTNQSELSTADKKQLLEKGGTADRDGMDTERVSGLGAGPAKHHEHIPSLTLKERELERLKREQERKEGGLTEANLVEIVDYAKEKEQHEAAAKVAEAGAAQSRKRLREEKRAKKHEKKEKKRARKEKKEKKREKKMLKKAKESELARSAGAREYRDQRNHPGKACGGGGSTDVRNIGSQRHGSTTPRRYDDGHSERIKNSRRGDFDDRGWEGASARGERIHSSVVTDSGRVHANGYVARSGARNRNEGAMASSRMNSRSGDRRFEERNEHSRKRSPDQSLPRKSDGGRRSGDDNKARERNSRDVFSSYRRPERSPPRRSQDVVEASGRGAGSFRNTSERNRKGDRSRSPSASSESSSSSGGSSSSNGSSNGNYSRHRARAGTDNGARRNGVSSGTGARFEFHREPSRGVGARQRSSEDYRQGKERAIRSSSLVRRSRENGTDPEHIRSRGGNQTHDERERGRARRH